MEPICHLFQSLRLSRASVAVCSGNPISPFTPRSWLGSEPGLKTPSLIGGLELGIHVLQGDFQ